MPCPECERLRAERDERSAEIARLLMKIERLRRDKSAWQDVAASYGEAIDRLRHILPPD